MLLQMLFFKIVQFSTSTRSILEEVLINYTLNKIVQLLNNIIVKGTYIFLLILSD
jgi:hypothetical protein